MISGENLFENILTVAILLGLLILVYARITGKTLVDMIREIREAFSDTAEETYETTVNTFENIR